MHFPRNARVAYKLAEPFLTINYSTIQKFGHNTGDRNRRGRDRVAMIRSGRDHCARRVFAIITLRRGNVGPAKTAAAAAYRRKSRPAESSRARGRPPVAPRKRRLLCCTHRLRNNEPNARAGRSRIGRRAVNVVIICERAHTRT